jgi:peptidoglycan/xylan/chitin deacetylase (PgdA/CDA1 family)
MASRISITFDDGYENIYHHAYPILKEYGFSATIFLITDFVGKENSWDVNMGWRRFRHLSWEEIHEMKGNGITFGSHTVTHRDLTKLPLDEVKMELSESKRILEEKIGKEVRYLSYPFGRYTDEIQEIAKEIGYSKAFTSYPRTKNTHTDPFAIGRIGIYIIDTLPEFRVKTLGGQTGMSLILYGIEDIKGRVINFLSHGTPLVKKLKHQ